MQSMAEYSASSSVMSSSKRPACGSSMRREPSYDAVNSLQAAPDPPAHLRCTGEGHLSDQQQRSAKDPSTFSAVDRCPASSVPSALAG